MLIIYSSRFKENAERNSFVVEREREKGHWHINMHIRRGHSLCTCVYSKHFKKVN